jgi:hypothetical protein
MKWLLAIVVFVAVVTLCAAVIFVIGCFSVPSLDAGSHGMAIPLLLGFVGFQWGIPLGFVAAFTWLLLRSHQEMQEAESTLYAMDEVIAGTPDEKKPNQAPEPTAPSGRGSP